MNSVNAGTAGLFRSVPSSTRAAVADAHVDARADAAVDTELPANVLGFPKAAGRAWSASANPPLPLKPADAAVALASRGFEDLPVVLVAKVIVAFLGVLDLNAIKGLASGYPHFGEAIHDAVNTNPLIQSLAKLVQPMRTIALRDFLEVGPFSERLGSQIALAARALRSNIWLHEVAMLVRHEMHGVTRSHATLMARCDAMLAGKMPEDKDKDVAVEATHAIGLSAERCRHIMNLALFHEPGSDATGLLEAVEAFRKAVLSDAFGKIASVFAAHAGWTIDRLDSSV
ncbi:MAG: hypothetical protein H7346_22340 [Burkholderiaceae bacterium]|nr:hypothetical protein [Burkholderiaceae bacterium]